MERGTRNLDTKLRMEGCTRRGKTQSARPTRVKSLVSTGRRDFIIAPCNHYKKLQTILHDASFYADFPLAGPEIAQKSIFQLYSF